MPAEGRGLKRVFSSEAKKQSDSDQDHHQHRDGETDDKVFWYWHMFASRLDAARRSERFILAATRLLSLARQALSYATSQTIKNTFSVCVWRLPRRENQENIGVSQCRGLGNYNPVQAMLA